MFLVKYVCVCVFSTADRSATACDSITRTITHVILHISNGNGKFLRIRKTRTTDNKKNEITNTHTQTQQQKNTQCHHSTGAYILPLHPVRRRRSRRRSVAPIGPRTHRHTQRKRVPCHAHEAVINCARLIVWRVRASHARVEPMRFCI